MKTSQLLTLRCSNHQLRLIPVRFHDVFTALLMAASLSLSLRVMSMIVWQPSTSENIPIALPQ
jgi:hypothetical protein